MVKAFQIIAFSVQTALTLTIAVWATLEYNNNAYLQTWLEQHYLTPLFQTMVISVFLFTGMSLGLITLWLQEPVVAVVKTIAVAEEKLVVPVRNEPIPLATRLGLQSNKPED
jgi:hypothetical protein